MSEESTDYKEAWIRARADYENLKKDTEKKKQEWVDFANLGLLVDLVPVIEHFNQALKYIPEEEKDADWIKGIEQIKKQLEEFMDKQGLRPIETVGQQFDTNLHEAIGTKKDEKAESGTIVEEVSGGYTLNGKLIQVAKVIVAE